MTKKIPLGKEVVRLFQRKANKHAHRNTRRLKTRATQRRKAIDDQ